MTLSEISTYKLFIDEKEIKHTGEISWEDDLTTICAQIGFSCDEIIAIGSKFHIMNNGKTVIAGIITDSSRGVDKIYSYTGFDYGFYLNKNEVVYQCKTDISTSIKQLCNKVGVKCGEIAQISTVHKQIFKGETVSDILFELLDIAKKKTNVNYHFECKTGELNIWKYEKVKDLYSNLGGIFKILSTNAIGSASVTESMQEMKNQVVVVDKEEKNKNTLAFRNNSQSIAKYGLLQKVETFDDSQKIRHGDFAKNILYDLNKITETISLEVLGNDSIKKGAVIPIKNEHLGLDGNYLIKSSKHVINGISHKITIDVKGYLEPI